MFFQFFDELPVAPIPVMFVALCLFGGAATAEPTIANLPDGWTLSVDGARVNAQSGVSCPKSIGPYNFVRLEGPAEPNRVGTCVYSAGEFRIGEIRIRKFADGVGETPLAISNDRALMGLGGGPNVPPGGKLVAANRIGPGPEINGTKTSQAVITSAHSGLLVDCVAQAKPEKSELDYGFYNFIKTCMHFGS